MRDGLSAHESLWMSSSTRVENAKELSGKAAKLFKSFCSDVKQSYGLSRRDKPWPPLSAECRVEHYTGPGPAIGDTVASNMD